MTSRYQRTAAGLGAALALLTSPPASAAPYAFALPEGVDPAPATGVLVSTWWDVSEHRWVIAPGWAGGATPLAVVFPITDASSVSVTSSANAAISKLMLSLGPTSLEVSCEDLYPFVDRRDTSTYQDYRDEPNDHPRLRHTQPGPLACNQRSPYYGGYYDYSYGGPYYAEGYGNMATGSRVDTATGPDARAASVRETAELDDVAAVGAWLAERSLTLAEPLAEAPGARWLAVVYDVTDDEPGRLPAVTLEDPSFDRLRLDLGDGDTDLIVYHLGEVLSPTMLRPIVPLGLDETSLGTDCLFRDDSVDVRYDAAVAEAFGPIGQRSAFALEHLSGPNQCIGCAGLPDLANWLPTLGWPSDIAVANTAISRVRLIVDAGAGPTSVQWQQLDVEDARFTAFVAWRADLESDFPVCGEGFTDDPASCLDEATARRARPGSRSGAVGTLGMAALGVALLVAGRRRRFV